MAGLSKAPSYDGLVERYRSVSDSKGSRDGSMEERQSCVSWPRQSVGQLGCPRAGHRKDHRAQLGVPEVVDVPTVWAYTEGAPAYLTSPVKPPLPQEIVVIGGVGDATMLVRRLEGCFSVKLPTEAIEVVDDVTYFAIDVFPESEHVAPWRVMRRYTEFRELSRSIAADSAWRQWRHSFVGRDFLGSMKAKLSSQLGVGRFPPRMLRCRGKALTTRRQRLEAWLNRLVSHHSWHSTSGNHLCRFLLFGRAVVPALCAADLGASSPDADLDASASVLCAAQAILDVSASTHAGSLGETDPVATASTSCRKANSGSSTPLFRPMEDEQTLMFVKVKLPVDVGAGQELTVKVPPYHVCLKGQVTITVPWGVLPHTTLSLWFDPKAGTLGAGQIQDGKVHIAE